MEVHPPDDEPVPFSFLNEYNGVTLAGGQVPCHMTRTNPRTHQIITENQHLNRHVMEEITGPRWVELGRVCCHGNLFRYCPSIESKIIRFGDKPHQIWLEPEGIHVHTCTAYMLHTYDYLKNCSLSLSLSLSL